MIHLRFFSVLSIDLNINTFISRDYSQSYIVFSFFLIDYLSSRRSIVIAVRLRQSEISFLHCSRYDGCTSANWNRSFRVYAIKPPHRVSQPPLNFTLSTLLLFLSTDVPSHVLRAQSILKIFHHLTNKSHIRQLPFLCTDFRFFHRPRGIRRGLSATKSLNISVLFYLSSFMIDTFSLTVHRIFSLPQAMSTF